LKQGISRLGIYKAIKLAQVPGGTIITSDNSIKIFNPNPKLDELVDLLAQIDEKVVIFHAFTEEGRIIEQVCEGQGWNFCSLRAEVTDKAKEIEKFQEDKNYRIMIAHPSSGGEGLNLQVANIAIFYSLGFIGHLRRDQAEGRIYRSGQNKKCTIIDLIAEDSMDEHLLTVQQEKRDVTEAILRFFER
jgi:SNF2 family DNA or RNA helicase